MKTTLIIGGEEFAISPLTAHELNEQLEARRYGPSFDQTVAISIVHASVQKFRKISRGELSSKMFNLTPKEVWECYMAVVELSSHVTDVRMPEPE